MKFKYLIADTFDGVCRGTNDESLALEMSECDEYFVMNAETGMAIHSGEEVPIIEHKRSE